MSGISQTTKEDWIKENLLYNPLTGVFNWSRPGHSRRETVGTLVKGYLVVRPSINGKRCSIPLHLAAFVLMNGKFPVSTVDHKDRNRSNNVWENLQITSKSGNARNRSIPKNNTSGIKGVSLHGQSQKYQAYIAIDGKQKYLGLFNTVEDAANARFAANKAIGGGYEL